MQHMRQALEWAITRQMGEKKLPLVKVCQVWPMLVGPELAMLSLPVRLEKGVLTVRVRTSSAAQDIAHQKAIWLPNLAALGVMDIKTRVSAKASSSGLIPPKKKEEVKLEHEGHEMAQALQKALKEKSRIQTQPLGEPLPLTAALHSEDLAKKLAEALKKAGSGP